MSLKAPDKVIQIWLEEKEGKLLCEIHSDYPLHEALGLLELSKDILKIKMRNVFYKFEEGNAQKTKRQSSNSGDARKDKG